MDGGELDRLTLRDAIFDRNKQKRMHVVAGLWYEPIHRWLPLRQRSNSGVGYAEPGRHLSLSRLS